MILHPLPYRMSLSLFISQLPYPIPTVTLSLTDVAQITAHGDASGLVDDVIATMYRKEEGEGDTLKMPRRNVWE